MDSTAYKKPISLLNKQANIFPHASNVNRGLRNQRTGHNSGVVWLTGLSGSGKSTVATGVEQALFSKGYLVSVLDGDTVRAGLNSDLDFSRQSRQENLRRVGEVAALFAETGHIVIATFISPHKTGREFVRDIVRDNFHTVYIRANLDSCIERDPKGLYKKALDGKIQNFTGLGQSYEEPEAPDLIIDTTEARIEDCQKSLMDYIEQKFALG